MDKQGTGYLFTALAFALIVFAGVGYLKTSLWNECRSTNSWFYCFMIVGGR